MGQQFQTILSLFKSKPHLVVDAKTLSIKNHALECEDSGDFQTAISFFTRYLDTDPQNSKTHFRKAICFRKLGSLVDCINCLNIVLSIDKSFCEAYLLKSQILFELNKLTD
mgnify:CR=1 FL=1